MKGKLILIITLLLISIHAFTQPSEITYLGNVARSGFINNGTYGPFNIGFSFTFYGNTYTQFYVSSNGLVLFGAGSTDGTEDPIPTAATPNNFIAVCRSCAPSFEQDEAAIKRVLSATLMRDRLLREEATNGYQN